MSRVIIRHAPPKEDFAALTFAVDCPCGCAFTYKFSDAKSWEGVRYSTNGHSPNIRYTSWKIGCPECKREILLGDKKDFQRYPG